jgi:hypothetical protein
MAGLSISVRAHQMRPHFSHWDAQRRGNVAQNVADSVTIAADKRGHGKLEVGNRKVDGGLELPAKIVQERLSMPTSQ